jgi:hypothetical protein
MPFNWLMVNVRLGGSINWLMVTLDVRTQVAVVDDGETIPTLSWEVTGTLAFGGTLSSALMYE